MSALSGCLCFQIFIPQAVHSWGPRFYLKHVRPFSVAMSARSGSLRSQLTLHLSPSLDSDVRHFGICQLIYWCPPFWDLCVLNSSHVSPSMGSDARCLGIPVLNSFLLSPSLDRDVRSFGISVLSILHMCLPACIVMSARLGSLYSVLYTFLPAWMVMPSILYICLPAWKVISALLGSLCSQFFTCVSPHG